jgi:hypothetical protein
MKRSGCGSLRISSDLAKAMVRRLLPSAGETMTTAAMATYAYDQIDQARAELNAVSK